MKAYAHAGCSSQYKKKTHTHIKSLTRIEKNPLEFRKSTLAIKNALFPKNCEFFLLLESMRILFYCVDSAGASHLCLRRTHTHFVYVVVVFCEFAGLLWPVRAMTLLALTTCIKKKKKTPQHTHSLTAQRYV